MQIRRYQVADHEQVVALHHLALERVGAHAGSGPWDDDLNHIEAVYLEQSGEFLVGVLGERIIALAALRRVSAEQAEVKRMRVHPDVQRQGYGCAMLRAIEARAAELGYRTLSLDTTVQQVGAQRFYERNGWQQVGSVRRGRFELLLYEKTLAP